MVTAGDVASLTATPDTWKEKAALPRMGYGTVLELVAEKFHASQAAIERLNPGAGWPNPPAGTEVTAPNPCPAPRAKAARLAVRSASISASGRRLIHTVMRQTLGPGYPQCRIHPQLTLLRFLAAQCCWCGCLPSEHGHRITGATADPPYRYHPGCRSRRGDRYLAVTVVTRFHATLG